MGEGAKGAGRGLHRKKTITDTGKGLISSEKLWRPEGNLISKSDP